MRLAIVQTSRMRPRLKSTYHDCKFEVCNSSKGIFKKVDKNCLIVVYGVVADIILMKFVVWW